MGHWDEFDGWVEDDGIKPSNEITNDARAQLARIGKIGGQHGWGKKKKIDPEVARTRARKAAQARWKK